MNTEYVIEEDKVLEFNYDELMPSGEPLVVELTLEEYNLMQTQNLNS
jgi:hypothetical protein